jgi:hypothetical protein
MYHGTVEDCISENKRKYGDDPQIIYVSRGKTLVTVYIPVVAPVTERGQALIMFILVLALFAIVAFGFGGAGWTFLP